jgi:lipopolysaccharide export system permease protein
LKLDIYLIKRFLVSFLTVLIIMCCISVLLEMTEYIRKYDINKIHLVVLFRLSLLNLPEMIYQILPLVILLSSLWMYIGLSRTSELVILRASSRSAIRSLLGPVTTTFLIGLLSIFFLNPIIVATSKYHQSIIDNFTNSTRAITAVLDKGLWMKQGTNNGQIIIQASKSDPTATFFKDLTMYGFNKSGRASYHLKAATASLDSGSWNLKKVKYWNFETLSDAGTQGMNFSEFSVATNVTPIQILKGFSEPNTTTLWELPKLISRLDQAGFPSIKHKIWFQMELANPILLICMVVIASAFVTKHARISNVGLSILIALSLGFGIYFLKNFANVLGQNLQIPVLVAAWAPPLAGIFISLGFLLHIEDG